MIRFGPGHRRTSPLGSVARGQLSEPAESVSRSARLGPQAYARRADGTAHAATGQPRSMPPPASTSDKRSSSRAAFSPAGVRKS
jgi:hypothetical protein